MTIDLAQARDLLKRAVETQGRDFVYNPGGHEYCYYVPLPGIEGPRGQTGCLIGVAMTLAGVNVTTGLWVGGIELNIVSMSINIPGLLTAEAERYFAIAQGVQDQGGTWGQSYDTAETHIGRYLNRN